MTRFTQFAELHEACQDLPPGSARAEAEVPSPPVLLSFPLRSEVDILRTLFGPSF